MTITLDGKYQTRDGCPVRIYALDGGAGYPVHGALFTDGEWILSSWTLDGCWNIHLPANRSSNWDLTEIQQ